MNPRFYRRNEVAIIKTEINEHSKNLIIELAKSLGIDFPKDKTCKDCFCYSNKDDWGNMNPNQHYCWEDHKITIRPSDPDDMSYQDYEEPYVIKNLEDAMDCPYYKSGLEEYKRLYNQSKQELDKLKKDIKNLCE